MSGRDEIPSQDDMRVYYKLTGKVRDEVAWRAVMKL
jgi:hypothetical protein